VTAEGLRNYLGQIMEKYKQWFNVACSSLYEDECATAFIKACHTLPPCRD
jgi:hypothetical protein